MCFTHPYFYTVQGAIYSHCCVLEQQTYVVAFVTVVAITDAVLWLVLFDMELCCVQVGNAWLC